MKKAKKLHQTVLTELGDGKISKLKKKKAEVLLCLFESKQYKDKKVFFLLKRPFSDKTYHSLNILSLFRLLKIQQAHGVLSNHQFFIGWKNENFSLRLGILNKELTLLVSCLIQRKS